MKNLQLVLLFVFFTVSISFAQRENMTITDVITINALNHSSESQSLTVPNGKFWVVNGDGSYYIHVKLKEGDNGYSISSRTGSNDPFFFTEGMELFFFDGDITDTDLNLIQILVYDAPTTFGGVLAINESSIPKENIILFPNPTSSQLSINSEKLFNVEVYDINGRKLIETNSTSIDFSELTIGIYLVKLFDEENTVVSTYKVIKK